MKRKESVLPEDHSDAGWRRAVWSLPLRWINGIWVGSQFLWGEKVRERIALMVSVRFTLVFLPVKSYKWPL